MALLAKKTGGGGMLAPEGPHRFVCIGVIDIGTHLSEKYGNWQHKVVLQWELSDVKVPAERMPDGRELPERPFIYTRTFTLSLHEKAELRRILTAWRGKAFTEKELQGFDMKNLLGAPGLMHVIHELDKSGTMRANLSSLTPLPKGYERPQPVGKLRYYSLDEGPPPDDLPEWMRKQIDESEERKQEARMEAVGAPVASPPGANGETSSDEEEDPIPF